MDKKEVDQTLQVLSKTFSKGYKTSLDGDKLTIQETINDEAVFVKALPLPHKYGITVEADTFKADSQKSFIFDDMISAVTYLEPYIRQCFDGIRRI